MPARFSWSASCWGWSARRCMHRVPPGAGFLIPCPRPSVYLMPDLPWSAACQLYDFLLARSAGAAVGSSQVLG